MKTNYSSEFLGVTARITHARQVTGDGWDHNVWRVGMRHENRRLQTTIRTGLALPEPTVKEVLELLVADSRLADDPDEFAEVMGGDIYDPAIEDKYLALEAKNVRFQELLGDRYEEFRSIKY